jgi:hypothetical protein
MTWERDTTWATTQVVLDLYGLPDIPDAVELDSEEDEANARQLVIFRQRLEDENIPLGDPVSLSDAQEYASRDDTRGTDSNSRQWFVGFQQL